MKVKVSVTQDHIDDGKQDHCAECPIALAIEDAIGIKPNADNLLAEKTDKPWEVTVFMSRFDDGCDVEPFDFTLNLNIKEAT